MTDNSEKFKGLYLFFLMFGSVYHGLRIGLLIDYLIVKWRQFMVHIRQFQKARHQRRRKRAKHRNYPNCNFSSISSASSSSSSDEWDVNDFWQHQQRQARPRKRSGCLRLDSSSSGSEKSKEHDMGKVDGNLRSENESERLWPRAQVFPSRGLCDLNEIPFSGQNPCTYGCTCGLVRSMAEEDFGVSADCKVFNDHLTSKTALETKADPACAIIPPIESGYKQAVTTPELDPFSLTCPTRAEVSHQVYPSPPPRPPPPSHITRTSFLARRMHESSSLGHLTNSLDKEMNRGGEEEEINPAHRQGESCEHDKISRLDFSISMSNEADLVSLTEITLIPLEAQL
ncbi:unnamed protein product [Protopolystoma xenopodis]|uniref:Uncharacterized protein n=1 Tax=Protopolystoma xenopodis TaxID=117903 RepID=A0A3S4ZDC0_9PLAT|nr:unnamed protein product [Protopolystoma xenopodis]